MKRNTNGHSVNNKACGQGDEDVKVRKGKRNSRRYKTGNSNGGDSGKIEGQRDEALMNDVKWYAPTQQLLNDVATYPFTWPQGKPIDISSGGVKFEPFASPGIMTFSVIPTIGISKDANSPINISANALYSTLRSANSGSKNYEAPDLMLYIMAMDNLYSLYAHMYRIYGLINRYSGTNLYSPRTILESLGVNLDGFRGRQHEFKARLDAFAFEIGRANVPNMLPIINRHQQLFSDVYVDDVSAKSQYYAFVPSGFYKFVETDGPGKLTFVKMPFFESVEDMFEYAYELLRPVSASSDMWLISGDVGKAFGDSSLVKLTLVPYEYILPISYSEGNKELLLQINNLTSLPNYVGYHMIENDNSSLDITQDVSIDPSGMTGPLQFNPYLVMPKQDWVGSSGVYAHLVNMPWDSPSPADVMIATRLQHNAVLEYPESDADNMVFRLTSCSTEIVTGINIWRTYGDADGVASTMSIEQCEVLRYTNGSAIDSFTAGEFLHAMVTAKAVASFRWHPALYRTCVVDPDQSGEGIQNQTIDSLPLVELNNYAVISHQDLDRMHDIAIKSEFGIF